MGVSTRVCSLKIKSRLCTEMQLGQGEEKNTNCAHVRGCKAFLILRLSFCFALLTMLMEILISTLCWLEKVTLLPPPEEEVT